MDFVELIPVILIALIALFIVTYLVWSILMPIIQSSVGSGERRRIQAKQNQLLKADQALKEQNYPLALQLLNQALYLDTISHNENLIKLVASHNLSLLGKLLVIADSQKQKLENVAILEELFNSRGGLLFSLYEAKLSFVQTKAERKAKGQSLPKWAREEYDRKIGEINERLETNKKSLLGELHAASQILSGNAPAEEVTYH